MIEIELFRLFGSILIDDSEANKSISNTGKKVEQLGTNIGKIGKKMFLGVTTPILGAATAAAKFATDFNKDLAQISTLIPGQTERLMELKDSIRDVAVATGKYTDEIAQGAYDVISAYGDSADTMQKVEINAKAATAGVATTSDALDLSSAIMKGYGDTTATANEKVMDLAFMTLKLGQTSFPDLAASMGKVVPMSNELGISQEELFAIYATGTGVTGNASEVSTQYQAVLKSLMTPTKSMTKLMEEMGVADGQAMIEKYGLADSISMIVEKSQETGEPLSSYIGSINGQVIALALAGEQSDVFRDKLGELQNSTGAAEEAFKEMTEGVNKTGFSWEQSKVRMQVATQKFGDTMAPILEKGADLIEKVTEKLNSLSPEQRESILKFTGMVAAIGPVLIIVGKLITIVGTTIGWFTKLMPIAKGLGLAIGGISAPVAITIGAIAAIIAIGVALWKNWDTVKEKASQLGTYLSTKFNNIKDAIMNPINKARDAVGKAIDKIKGFFNFKFTWPKLTMPKFSISGSMNPVKWLKEGVPKLSVNWNAEGGIFDRPTIFDTRAGLQGVGEAGPEAIMPLSKLQDLLDMNGSKSTNIDNIFNIEKLVVREEADIKKIAEELFKLQNRKMRVQGAI